jgi:hypothetical protein
MIRKELVFGDHVLGEFILFWRLADLAKSYAVDASRLLSDLSRFGEVLWIQGKLACMSLGPLIFQLQGFYPRCRLRPLQIALIFWLQLPMKIKFISLQSLLFPSLICNLKALASIGLYKSCLIAFSAQLIVLNSSRFLCMWPVAAPSNRQDLSPVFNELLPCIERYCSTSIWVELVQRTVGCLPGRGSHCPFGRAYSVLENDFVHTNFSIVHCVFFQRFELHTLDLAVNQVLQVYQRVLLLLSNVFGFWLLAWIFVDSGHCYDCFV